MPSRCAGSPWQVTQRSSSPAVAWGTTVGGCVSWQASQLVVGKLRCVTGSVPSETEWQRPQSAVSWSTGCGMPTMPAWP